MIRVLPERLTERVRVRREEVGGDVVELVGVLGSPGVPVRDEESVGVLGKVDAELVGEGEHGGNAAVEVASEDDVAQSVLFPEEGEDVLELCVELLLLAGLRVVTNYDDRLCDGPEISLDDDGVLGPEVRVHGLQVLDVLAGEDENALVLAERRLCGAEARELVEDAEVQPRLGGDEEICLGGIEEGDDFFDF